jgi:hypothetical protein
MQTAPAKYGPGRILLDGKKSAQKQPVAGCACFDGQGASAAKR